MRFSCFTMHCWLFSASSVSVYEWQSESVSFILVFIETACTAASSTAITDTQFNVFSVDVQTDVFFVLVLSSARKERRNRCQEEEGDVYSMNCAKYSCTQDHSVYLCVRVCYTIIIYTTISNSCHVKEEKKDTYKWIRWYTCGLLNCLFAVTFTYLSEDLSSQLLEWAELICMRELWLEVTHFAISGGTFYPLIFMWSDVRPAATQSLSSVIVSPCACCLTWCHLCFHSVARSTVLPSPTHILTGDEEVLCFPFQLDAVSRVRLSTLSIHIFLSLCPWDFVSRWELFTEHVF